MDSNELVLWTAKVARMINEKLANWVVVQTGVLDVL